MAEAPAVDLNADVGEAVDQAGVGVERALLAFVTSVHVACGGHAGDATSMRDTVSAARKLGVRIGAHPSYPDREGFGRQPMELGPDELTEALVAQLAALAAVCEELDAPIVSVKPHGALYGEVGRAGPSFDALLAAVDQTLGDRALLVLAAGSAGLAACRDRGRAALAEGFCDRAYNPDGSLVDRSMEGALLTDGVQAGRQAVNLVRGGTVDTLCIHGDSPGAVALAEGVRHALDAAGIAVRPATP